MVRFGSQDLFWYVMEWSGFVWLGNAVKVRCCRYGIGAYWLGTAVQVRTAKVFRGRVRSGWAGSLQWNELVGFCMVWQGRKFALVWRGLVRFGHIR